MKVLVLYNEYPENSRVLLVDMSKEELDFLAPAHDHLVGCYSGDTGNSVSKALCAWNYALVSLGRKTDEEIELDNDATSWMEDEGVDLSWFNRFEGRITELKHPGQTGSFDAFITTGLAM